MEIPTNDKKAIPIRPVINIVIPSPFNPSGTFEYFIFSRIAASATMARKKPVPEPKPKAVASTIV